MAMEYSSLLPLSLNPNYALELWNLSQIICLSLICYTDQFHMKDSTILIGHGSGGVLTHNLIDSIFARHFANSLLDEKNDSAIVETSSHTAFTTDSYVIDPLFFPGGNIGHLAISGTVNDLLVSGAKPEYLSAGFIIEEGFSIADLERIVLSMAEEAKRANIKIVTGDTKVVKRGQCDKLFINTSGIGRGISTVQQLWGSPQIEPGDQVIVSGSLGDHAIAILAARNALKFEQEVLSDVAPLNDLIEPLFDLYPNDIRFMRDITRGGLATVLNEITVDQNYGIALDEAKTPVHCQVQGICEVFGYDPLYLANEGKIVLIVRKNRAPEIIATMKKLPYGKECSIIGELTDEHRGRVVIKSVIGGSRVVDMLSGEMLPRIC